MAAEPAAGNPQEKTMFQNPLPHPPTSIPATKTQLGYGDYLRFRELVLERSGLHFPDKKRADLEAGLFKALASSPLQRNGSYNLDEYYNLLRDRGNPASRAEMDRLIKALTVGETHFFRDQAQFDALATHVLPLLIARKRKMAAAAGAGIQPQLRLWSAGCATGEEPYSLAILLKELLPDLDQWRILILATDINPEALIRAGEALYSDWSFRECRAKALRSHYFTQEPNSTRYRLRPDIRHMVTFTTLNLIEDHYPTFATNTASMDLILCRNVTIYFTEETTRQVVQRFYKTLVEGGWLVVGHSEPSLITYRAFQAHTFPDTLLYQKIGQPADGPKLAPALAAGEAKIIPEPAAPACQPHPNALSIQPLTIPANSTPVVLPAPAKTVEPATAPVIDPYEVAQTLLQKGQSIEAITKLQQKLETSPNFAPAHSLLGLAYANRGQWAEARHWCYSALKIDSLLAEAYYVLSLVHQHEDQIEPAIDLLKKAIYLDRQAPLHHFNLGLLYHRQGQTRLARRAYATVTKLLEKYSPETIIPNSGGITAKHLLDTTRRFMAANSEK